jgi:hypothetical protein
MMMLRLGLSWVEEDEDEEVVVVVVVVVDEAGRACPKGRSRSHKTASRARS